MLEYKVNGTAPNFGSTDPEDHEFWKYMLAYWAQVVNDDFPKWKEHQIEYFKKVALPFEAELSRRKVFDDIIAGIKDSEYSDELLPLLDDWDGFSHWYSIISTRNHGGNKE